MAASSVPTVTVLGTTKLQNGKVKNRIKIALGANYAVATGVPLTAALCGLLQFEVQSSGSAFIDPVVTGVNQGGILAEIIGLALFLSYPTGGVTAAPATPAQPLITAGATAVTGSAATGPFTPGLGKAFPDQAVTTGLIVFADAYGYPAVA